MQRNYLDKSFSITTWNKLQPYYDELNERKLNNTREFLGWLKDISELTAVISEDLAWRYIKKTCDTENTKLRDNYIFFTKNITPHLDIYKNLINKKIAGSPFIVEVAKKPGYGIMFRGINSNLEIFCKQNIPLFTEIQTSSVQHGEIFGSMQVAINGKQLTLQQAEAEMQNTDRKYRKDIFNRVTATTLKQAQQLNQLFDKLLSLRNQVALNAGFENFRDYQFKYRGHFDYSAQDCFEMHESIKQEVLPVTDKLTRNRQLHLKVESLKPWDLSVNPESKKPLKPFNSADDLLKKSIQCFTQIDPFFGECLKTMQTKGFLDLDSRKGKAPGGYNYPLAESGIPFIFMNATSILKDVVTMVHEGGHAVHTFLADSLELTDFKRTPSEVAELASMSMELISMDAWHVFFEHPDDLKRAKREQLERIFTLLPHIAKIDKFQHWIYENPHHSHDQRVQQWNQIFDDFSDSVTNWQGLEENKDFLWQRQLHIFQLPFYYIEYGMAQLGAIAIWKNYKQNKEKCLQNYKAALKLGYTKSVPEIYQTANIKFDFSKAYIRELVQFVESEIELLS